MACLPTGRKQTDANSITCNELHLDVPGEGGAVYKHGQAGAGDHLLLNTGGGDLNYLLADETGDHKQVRRCHNATLQLLTDSHTDQISRPLT